MRFGVLLLTLCMTASGAFFWYSQMQMPCDTPIHYKIGAVDSRFGMSTEEVRTAVERAEKVWELPLTTELFVYDEKDGLPINFVFDARQEESNEEEELRDDLTTKEGVNESVAEQYSTLVKEFNTLRAQYESRATAYEKELTAYNTEVSDWNNRGGAPEDVRAGLESRASALKKEQEDLQTFAKRLNSITDEINRIGARGNSIIAEYNSAAQQYNDHISHVDEFAQGDYTGSAINVYEFDSQGELTIVLAHELGHALSLNHVEGESSVMYHRVDTQDLMKGITPEDRAEYARVCTNRSTTASFIRWVRGLL